MYANDYGGWLFGRDDMGSPARVYQLGNYNPMIREGMGLIVDDYLSGAIQTIYCPASRMYDTYRWPGTTNKTRWEAKQWAVYNTYNYRVTYVDRGYNPVVGSFFKCVGSIPVEKLGRRVFIADLVGGATAGNEHYVIAHRGGYGRWNTWWADGSVTSASGNQKNPADPVRTVYANISWNSTWGRGGVASSFLALDNQ